MENKKNEWVKPELKVYGDMQSLTQVVKTFGTFDGIFVDPDGPNQPNPPVPVGFSS